jgi:hypothetical protein
MCTNHIYFRRRWGCIQSVSLSFESAPIRFSIVFNLTGVDLTSFGAKFAKKRKNDFALVAWISVKVDYFSKGNEFREKLCCFVALELAHRTMYKLGAQDVGWELWKARKVYFCHLTNSGFRLRCGPIRWSEWVERRMVWCRFLFWVGISKLWASLMFPDGDMALFLEGPIFSGSLPPNGISQFLSEKEGLLMIRGWYSWSPSHALSNGIWISEIGVPLKVCICSISPRESCLPRKSISDWFLASQWAFEANGLRIRSPRIELPWNEYLLLVQVVHRARTRKMFFWPPQTYIHTHFFFFHLTLLKVEGTINSRNCTRSQHLLVLCSARYTVFILTLIIVPKWRSWTARTSQCWRLYLFVVECSFFGQILWMNHLWKLVLTVVVFGVQIIL